MKTERTKGSDVVQWISHPTREPVIVWANCSPERQEKVRIWHRVLDTILLGLSLNQLVAGLGLWTCTVIAFQFKSGDPHAVLAYNMSAASSFSQLQIPYVLHKQGKARRSDRRIARLRRHLFDINLLLLLLSAVVQTEETHNPSAMIGFAVALFFSYYARLVASQRVADYMDRKTKALEHTKWSRRPLHASLRGCRMLFRKFDTSPVSRTMCSFSISAGFTLWALVVVIRLKLFPHRFGYTNCDLNTEDENRWTFGQILAVLMIVAIVLPGFDTYFGESTASFKKHHKLTLDQRKWKQLETGKRAGCAWTSRAMWSPPLWVRSVMVIRQVMPNPQAQQTVTIPPARLHQHTRVPNLEEMMTKRRLSRICGHPESAYPTALRFRPSRFCKAFAIRKALRRPLTVP